MNDDRRRSELRLRWQANPMIAFRPLPGGERESKVR